MMRPLLAGLTAVAAIAYAFPALVHAADDDTVARAREMLRRTQEALHQAQADNAELARAKSEAERKLEAASKQIDVAQSGSKAAQSQLRAQLQSAQGIQAELQQKLSETTGRLAEANAKESETAKLLTARESELAQVKQALEQSKTVNASCEDKNLKLYSYAEEVLERYKNKGVWASLSQKDPVLGLKEVGVENVVQEYRLKFSSQKIKP
jgi:DNA repair exonuclease SbcCD ATPase subunit